MKIFSSEVRIQKEKGEFKQDLGMDTGQVSIQRNREWRGEIVRFNRGGEFREWNEILYQWKRFAIRRKYM